MVKKMSVDQMLDMVTQGTRHDWDKVRNYFDFFWLKPESLKGSNEIIARLTQIENQGTPPLLSRNQNPFAIDLGKYGIKQRERAKKLPLLEDLIKRIEAMNPTEDDNNKLHSRLSDLRCSLRSEKWSLNEPPFLAATKHDHAGITDSNSRESFTVAQLMAICPIYDEIVDEMDKLGLGGIEALRKLPDTFGYAAIHSGSYNQQRAMQLWFAYKPKEALLPLLSTAPEWLGNGRELEFEIPDFNVDEFLAKTKDNELHGFPRKQAYNIIKLAVNAEHTHDGFPFPLETQPFYWNVMKSPIYKWAGLKGYIKTLGQQTVRLHDDGYEYGDEDRTDELIDENAQRIIEQLELDKKLAKVPLRFGRALLREAASDNSLRTAGFNIEYFGERIGDYWQSYKKAMRKAIRHFPNITIPTFESIITSSGISTQMRSIENFHSGYHKKGYTNYQHPLLVQMAESAGTKIFSDTMGTDRIITLDRMVDVLEEVRPNIPEAHFNGLVGYVGKLCDENTSQLKRFVGIFKDKSAWTKFGKDDRRSQEKRNAIQRISLLAKNLKGANLDIMAAKKEQSLAVLEKLANDYWYKQIKEDLPFGAWFLEGLQCNSWDTYKVYRDIACQNGLAQFAISMMTSATPVQKSRKDRYKTAYNYYAKVEKTCGGTIDNKRVRAERKRLDKLQDQVTKFQKEEGTNAEQHADARRRKAIKILSRQMNRAILTAWQASYRIGLENIVGHKFDKEIPFELKTAVGIYHVSEEYEPLQKMLATIIQEHVGGKPYSHLTDKTNFSFLQGCRARGIKTKPWTNGMSRNYIAGVQTHTDRKILRQRYEEEILDICAKYDIETQDPYIAYQEATKKITNINVLADLETQMTAIHRLGTSTAPSKPQAIRIYLETDPMRQLMIGEVVRDSCLGVGKGNSYNAINVTVDADKAVLYAVDPKGNIMGRKIIAISDEHKLVQYHAYQASDLALDKSFEKFIDELSSKMNIELANHGLVKGLHHDHWYNDGIHWFEHIDVNDSRRAEKRMAS